MRELRFLHSLHCLTEALVQEFTVIVRGSPIYDPTRFDAVKVSAQTQYLVRAIGQDQDEARLNRLLLEDGYPGAVGSANPAGSAAQFYFPTGLALDAAGFLYVADSGTHLLRTTRVVPPTLQFTFSAGQLVLSWPVSANGFGLETASAVSPGAAWTPLTNGVGVVGDNFVLTNALNAAPRFYRLHNP